MPNPPTSPYFIAFNHGIAVGRKPLEPLQTCNLNCHNLFTKQQAFVTSMMMVFAARSKWRIRLQKQAVG